jgi:hypothetical protein
MITDRRNPTLPLGIQRISRGQSLRTLRQGARTSAVRPDMASRDGHAGTMYARVPWRL